MANDPTDMIQAAAETRILATRDRLLSEQKHVRQEQRRLSELERELDRKMSDCLAAARFFGIEVSIPVDDEAISEAQRRVRLYEMRLRASETEVERQHLLEQLNRYRARLTDLTARKEAEVNSQQSTQEALQLTPATDSAAAKSPKVREVTLDRLQAAGPRGEKAASIRSFIEQSYSVTLHEKTVGMTLYRLSQENRVHRKGQVWFYGSQAEQALPARSENPGAGAPGNTHVAS